MGFKKEMKDVTAAIILKDSKVLIARRAQGENHAGSWEFPGGKVELAETPEQCLKRELLEEFGIDVLINDFVAESVYEYPMGSIRLLAYMVDILNGEIRLSVHDDYHWVALENLLEYNLLPADVPIAMKLKEVFL
jgi:8-oxo-dGTP diphosphatase